MKCLHGIALVYINLELLSNQSALHKFIKCFVDLKFNRNISKTSIGMVLKYYVHNI